MKKGLSRLALLAMLLMSLAGGYFIYKISGRGLPADYIRPALALLLLLSGSLLCLKAGFKKCALVLNVLMFSLFFVFGAVYLYYRSIGAVFTGDDVVAIAQSNAEEVYDFLSHYVLNAKTLLLLVAVIAAGCVCSALLSRRFDAPSRSSRVRAVFLSLAALFTVASVLICTQLRPVKYYRLMVSELHERIAVFNEMARELERSAAGSAVKDAKGELYVLIIGESLSRDSMGLYTGIADNTPFLDSLAKEEGTVVFKNAYSSFVNTVPSITASFSSGNLYTGLTFPHGDNLISMAKSAGFKTFWISNQVKNGNADTPIGAISSLADHSYFTTNFVFDGSYSQQPDEILLPEIEKTLRSLDDRENNFVIIHLMGNHSPYYNRFPNDYPVIRLSDAASIGSLINKPPFSEKLLEASDYENYLTSIRYNDDILSRIMSEVRKHESFRSMVYYSDHGEALLYQSYNDIREESKGEPAGRHNLAQFGYAMTRIPFIVNCSKEYVSQYPETFEALKSNSDRILTNDTLYDFMLSLMRVKTDRMNKSLSAAEKEFNPGDPDSIKLVGERLVGSDPDYIAYANATTDFSRRLAIRSANSLFKAKSSMAKGYKALHLDTVLHEGRLYVRAVRDFDSSLLALDEFAKRLGGKDVLLIADADPAFGKREDFRRLQEALGDHRIMFITHGIEQYAAATDAGFDAMLSTDKDPGAESPVAAVLLEEGAPERAALAQRLKERGIRVSLMFDALSVQDRDLRKHTADAFDAEHYIVQYHNAFDSALD